MKIPSWFRKARPPQGRAAAVLLGGWNAGLPQGYEAQVRAAYMGNAVAQRAVRLIAEGLAGAPVNADPPGHPALALLGTALAGPPLLETVAANLLLHGNAFVDVALGGDGLPAALYALRPERVTVEADMSGWPVAYRYRAGEAVTRYPAENAPERAALLHIRGFHPLDDLYGLGCLGAAAAAVETHNAAARWNKALLDNAARPSGAMIYAPGDGSVLSGQQFERLRAELEASFAGASNAGRPLLLEGGMTWQPLSLTPAEMDFAAARDAAAREIALAFGVPPMLLGLPGDNSYANYREANVALWRLTLLPLAARILDALAGHLSLWWPNLRLGIDRDAVPALSADRERLWAQVSRADFLSADEKRGILGIGRERGR